MLSLEDRIRGYEPFFGKWQLKSYMPLGEGTSGTVYPIRSGEYEAALKVIPIPKNEKTLQSMFARLQSEDAVRAELEQELGYVKAEIETMRLLEGESNIVYFTDSSIIRRSDTYGWDVLICMEKLVRIDYFLKDPKIFGYSFNMDLIMHIWTEMVAGLCVCERNNIVHFDIKPENIFYAPGKNHFKLGDFGVAVNTRGRMNVMQGGFVGTKDYAAPEMWNREGGDSRSDIYSLAMVIYQLLNGYRIPFVPVGSMVTHDDFVRAFDERVVKKRAIPPIKGVHPDIMRILLRCLEYDPDSRYPSFEALRHDLMQVIYGGGSASGSVQPGANVDPRKPRSLVVPIIAVAASLGVAGAMVGIGMSAMNKNKEADVPAAVVADTPTPEPVYETEEVETIASPEITEAVTEAPEESAFAVNSGFRHYLDSEKRLLSVLNASIGGDVHVEARLNGEEIAAKRIDGMAADELPGDWGIEADRWPSDGVYIITSPEIKMSHRLELNCFAADGNILYSEAIDFHLDEFNGRTAFMAGNYIAPLRDVEIRGYDFEAVNGAVRPGQKYQFFGVAEPNSTLNVYANSQDNYIGNVVCDAEGNWSYTLNEALLSDDVRFRLLVGYEGSDAAFSEEFCYDASVSTIELGGPILADSIRLSGMTEANAELRLMINGSGVASAAADGSGYFEMRLPIGGLSEGDAYELTVTDSVGNTANMVGNVGKRSMFAPIELSSPVSGVYGRSDDILVAGTAQTGERIWVISEELGYSESFETAENGAFEVRIPLPEDHPEHIVISVQYENAEDGYAASSLEYDLNCELQFINGISVGNAGLRIQSEPHSSGIITMYTANDVVFTRGNIVCDANGFCDFDLSYALPLEGDRVVVYMQDSFGNEAESELYVAANPDLQVFTRADSSNVPLGDSLINIDSYERHGMRFVFEGYTGAAVNLKIYSGGEEVHSCRMDETNGVFSADVTDFGFADGHYTFAAVYEDRIDMEYCFDAEIMLSRPAIEIHTEIVEGSRTVQGFTTPMSEVRIFNSDSGDEIGSSYSSVDGSFTIALKAPIEPGQYVFEAVDGSGNTGILDFGVVARTELTISVQDEALTAVNASVESLALYGVADPNREIDLMINGESYARFNSGEDGWSYELPAADLPEGAFELSVMYASGEGRAAVLSFEKDTQCMLEVDTFNESAWFITGVTDLDAQVELFYNGEALTIGSIMPNGQFSVNLTNAVPMPLSADQQFVIRATDAHGNMAECTVQPTVIERAPISLKMKPNVEEGGYLTENIIRVSGKAERNTNVAIELTVGDYNWRQEASAKLGKYDVSVEIPPEIVEGEVVVRVSYADGFAAASSAEQRFMVDRSVPELIISGGLSAGLNDIYGSCSENCAVRLLVNGEQRAETVPYEDGRLIFWGVELAEGDSVQFEAVDGAGNSAVSAVAEVGVQAEGVGGAIVSHSESFNVGDTVRFEGWFGVNSARSVSIHFYHDGNLIREEKLAAGDMNKMHEGELEYAAGEHGLTIDAQTGYWFNKEIVLNRTMAVGDIEAVLCIDTGSDQIVLHDTAMYFFMERPEIDVEVNNTWIGSNHAFGFDGVQPRQEYSSGNVLLSGWIYGDETLNGEIGGVRIESLDGSVAPVNLVFNPIDTIEEISGSEGVYYCTRDAEKAFPQAAENGLGSVAVKDIGAGFMIALHQYLPDGDYIITLETSFEGGYEFTADTVFTVNNSLNEAGVDIAREVLNNWTMEMVTP